MEKLIEISEEEWENVNHFNKTILEEFLNDSTELSPKTKKVYRSNLRIWFVWVMKFLDNKKETMIKPLDFKRYQNWLMNRGVSSSDVNNKRAAVSALNNYIEIYYGDEFPMFRNFINRSIKHPPETRVHEKTPLSKEEFEHLVEVLEHQEEWQKVAYLLFTFDTGCRRAESRQLEKEVVNYKPIIKKKIVRLEDGTEGIKTVTYYRTHPIRCKGPGQVGKVRQFLFGERTMEALKRWVEARGDDDCEFMFISRCGDKVSQCSENLFNTWSTNVFTPIIGRRVHPHQLRISRASQLAIDSGVDIRVIQKLLGHESVSTTEGYIVRDDSEDLDELFYDGGGF